MKAATAVRIRGGRGLGDALYLRAIAEHFNRAGQDVTALTDYTDVFIESGITTEPFNRERSGVVVAHYIAGKSNSHTTQWQDVCLSAHVREAVPLRFAWRVRNSGLVHELKRKAEGRPLILVHGGREPMDRHDGFGLDLLPQKAAFDAALEALGDCYRVQIGKAKQIYALPVDVDLNGSTRVSDLLDLASVCDGIVAQCSFAIPLAEVFDKPLLAVWSAKAGKSSTPFIRLTTPQKVLSGARDSFVVDHWPDKMIREEARAFRFVA